MSKRDQFPEFLLQSSAETRKEYFYRKTIAHPRLEQAKQNVLSFIDTDDEPEIIIVTGPTGVGKTTLAAKIEDQILQQNLTRMSTDKSYLPVISLTTPAPDKDTEFDWREFYIDWLKAFKEPCVYQKQLFEDSIYTDQPFYANYATNGMSELRSSVVQTMKMRETRVLIIDEANHLLTVKPNNMAKQFQAIKSLSQKCKATIILIGTYDLLQILEQSAQLVRRGRVVHMARYDDYDADDKLAFKNALYTFQRHMPFEIEPDLLSHFEAFYLKSAGCIGILKKWLNRAVREGIKRGLKTIDWPFILQYAHSNKSIKTVLEEALVGERKLQDIDVSELRNILKSHHRDLEKTTKKSASAPSLPETEVDQVSLPALPRDKKSVKSQVGKRKPVRDSTEINFALFT
jgi:DNA replication protein DnaC